MPDEADTSYAPNAHGALHRADKSDMSSRRAARRTTAIRARVVTADGRTADCMVRDVSSTGARIGLAPHFDLPPTFRLQIGERSMPVRLAWRDGIYAGVVIGTAPAETSAEAKGQPVEV